LAAYKLFEQRTKFDEIYLADLPSIYIHTHTHTHTHTHMTCPRPVMTSYLRTTKKNIFKGRPEFLPQYFRVNRKCLNGWYIYVEFCHKAMHTQSNKTVKYSRNLQEVHLTRSGELLTNECRHVSCATKLNTYRPVLNLSVRAMACRTLQSRGLPSPSYCNLNPE
jgi:hypothetical protein